MISDFSIQVDKNTIDIKFQNDGKEIDMNIQFDK